MKKYITVERVIILALIVLLVVSLIGRNREVRERDARITELQLENQELRETSNMRGQTILQQEVIVTESQEAISSLTDSIFALKKSEARKIKEVIAYYKSITKTRIDSVEVPYVDVLERKRFSDSVERECGEVIRYMNENTIVVPNRAVYLGPHYEVDFTATRQGVMINNLSIPDTQYVRFVELKGGLLKKNQEGKRELFLKRSVRVDVIHSNPLIKVEGQNSVLYVPPKKKGWVGKAVAVGIGVFIGTKL